MESAREGSDSDSIADEERCSCDGLDAENAKAKETNGCVCDEMNLANKNITFIS